MSWTALLVLAFGAYGFKVAGSLGLGSLMTGPQVVAVAGLLPPAVLAGLIMLQTVSVENDLVLDARTPGVVAGGLAAWRGAPFWLVALVAAVVTGAIRAAT